MAREGLGDAYINLHLDEGPFDRELAKAKVDAEKILNDVGRAWGNTLSDSTAEELKRHGKDITHAIEDSTAHETIHVRSEVDYYNVRDKKGRFTRRIAQDIEQDIEQAFRSATSPNGPFAIIGQSIRDAVGSGFNVPGGSPLILALIPLIAALVVGVIELLNAAAGVATTLLSLMVAIGLQAGVLYLAFKGFGTALTGAFAAKNAQELEAALKNLTPAARHFVEVLLPLKGYFEALQKQVQSIFFANLDRDNAFTKLINSLGPTFFQGALKLAGALGYAFNQLALMLGSPLFKTFLNDVFKATVTWLQRFTPHLIQFLDALIRMSDAALPFLLQIGDWISHGLYVIADFINGAVLSGDFQKWLGGLKPILDSLGKLTGAALNLIIVLTSSTGKAGGKSVLDTLAESLDRLAIFFGSPVGVKALEGFIDLANFGIAVLTGLITILGLVAAAFDLAGESIKAFFSWLGDLIGAGLTKLGDFFVWLGRKIEQVWNGIIKFLRGPFQAIGEMIDNIIGYFASLPQRIIDKVVGFGSLLYDAGKNLIRGLIRGVESQIHELALTLTRITNFIPSWKGPEDKDRKLLQPAGRAVMEGFITGVNSGARELRDALTGITHQLSATRSNTGVAVNFGPGAINVSFMGNPTAEQAYQTGQAVGSGINSELAMRNVTLGVRRM